MTENEFKEHLAVSMNRRYNVLFGKGMEYQTDDDFLSNFKDVAFFTGVTPMQAWAVLFMKQVLAILRYVRTGKESVEGMESRFDDAANYLDLGWALIVEKKA